MQDYDWPGNVRELQNAVERAVVMADTPVIHHFHLPQTLQSVFETDAIEGPSLFEAVEAFERDLIRNALRKTRGNRNQAAKLLRVSERALAYKVRKHGIDHADFRDA